MLSREMGTHLTGRHISKELFPFSFEEYLDFSKSSAGLEAANEYLNYFENAYMVFFVQKFSYSYRKQIQNPRKVYAIDTGLVFVNSISHSLDRGRRFENMVFLSLRRKYGEIFYFSERGACDFVICQKGKPKLLIQACVQLTNDNLGREMEGLYEAMKELGLRKGLLLTMEQEDHFKKDGLAVEGLPFHRWKP